jgi:hypothetical protein
VLRKGGKVDPRRGADCLGYHDLAAGVLGEVLKPRGDVNGVADRGRASLAVRSMIGEIENRLSEGSWSLLGRVVPDAIQ